MERFPVGLDYDGNLFVFNKKITNNPLLKLNLEAVVCHSYKELIRKVVVERNRIYLMGMRGSLHKVKFNEAVSEGDIKLC